VKVQRVLDWERKHSKQDWSVKDAKVGWERRVRLPNHATGYFGEGLPKASSSRVVMVLSSAHQREGFLTETLDCDGTQEA